MEYGAVPESYQWLGSRCSMAPGRMLCDGDRVTMGIINVT
jgi:hypothetical protein